MNVAQILLYPSDSRFMLSQLTLKVIDKTLRF